MRTRRRLFVISLCGVLAFVPYSFWNNRREHRHDAAVLAAAKHYAIDPALVKAVIWRETRFKADAKGKAGEVGLMQIMESTALDWASAEKIYPFEHEELFDPAKNTAAGSWYLAKLLKRYTQTDNPIPYALADYNAGRGNVLKWNKGEAATNSEIFIQQIGFPGTSNYVRSVMQKLEHYRAEFSPETNVIQPR